MAAAQVSPVPRQIPPDYQGQADPEKRPDNQFTEMAMVIIKQASFQCAVCGYKDFMANNRPRGMMSIHPLDGNREDRTAPNWICVCPICKDLLEPGYGADHERGEFVFSSLVSQVELVSLTRHALMTINNNGMYAKVARSFYDELRSALWRTTRSYFPGSYDGKPQTLHKLLSFDPFIDALNEGDVTFENIRYLPLIGGYPEAMDHWTNTRFGEIPENHWQSYRRHVA